MSGQLGFFIDRELSPLDLDPQIGIHRAIYP